MSKVSDSSHVGDIGVSSVTIPLPQSSKYSDFSIECNGVAFPVHKIIVCTRSPVIGAAVDRGFKESVEGVFRIHGFSTGAVRRMLQFLYTGDYTSEDDGRYELESEPEPSPVSDINDNKPSLSSDMLQHHVEMNAIANFYAVAGLSSLANRRIAMIFDNNKNWNAASFSKFVQTAYEISNDVDLSEISTTVAARHIDELMACPPFKAMELPSSFYFDTLCKAMSRLKADSEEMRKKLDGLSTAVLGIIRGVNQGFCTICGETFGCEINAHDLHRFEIRCRNCGHVTDVADSFAIRSR